MLNKVDEIIAEINECRQLTFDQDKQLTTVTEQRDIALKKLSALRQVLTPLVAQSTNVNVTKGLTEALDILKQ